MAIHSHEAFRKKLSPHEKYFCDTSFVIDCYENPGLAANKLKSDLLSNNCTLIINSVVRNELLHYLRKAICESFFSESNSKICQPIHVSYNDTKNYDWLKQVHMNGYGRYLEAALGKNGEVLNSEYEQYVAGTVYWSAGKLNLNNGTLEWNNLNRLMGHYGLDSSDSMMLNFACTTKDFKGLISNDCDFRYAKTHQQDFDIIIPEKYMNMPVDLDWQNR